VRAVLAAGASPQQVAGCAGCRLRFQYDQSAGRRVRLLRARPESLRGRGEVPARSRLPVSMRCAGLLRRPVHC
jgi:hypothetical protein